MKPKVRFILELNFSSRTQKDRYLSLYGEKFFNLIKEAKSKRYFASDYDNLEPIRQLLRQHGKVADLIPALTGQISEANLIKLTDVSPVFNVAPRDLQAYLLMSLGLRIHSNVVQHEQETVG